MLHLSCWLVLASGAALTGELLYGLCLLAYAALAAVSMTLAELRRGIEEEAPGQAQALFAAPELTSRRLWLFSASLGLFSATCTASALARPAQESATASTSRAAAPSPTARGSCSRPSSRVTSRSRTIGAR
jgi:hypothetical protein